MKKSIVASSICLYHCYPYNRVKKTRLLDYSSRLEKDREVIWDSRLLNYFGEQQAEPCGYCDNCEAGITIEEDQQELPFPLNARVVHKFWGEGMVLRYEGDKMVVLFDSVGYKTLSVAIVTEHDVLSALSQESEKSV